MNQAMDGATFSYFPRPAIMPCLLTGAVVWLVF